MILNAEGRRGKRKGTRRFCKKPTGYKPGAIRTRAYRPGLEELLRLDLEKEFGIYNLISSLV
jgi:hypothetical protein